MNQRSISECRAYKNLLATTVHFGDQFTEDDDEDDDFALKEYDCNPFTGLIVGGTVTEVGEFPHMAAIGWRYLNGSVTFNCGGSLISESFVLSVAHCADIEG